MKSFSHVDINKKNGTRRHKYIETFAKITLFLINNKKIRTFLTIILELMYVIINKSNFTNCLS